MFQNLTINNTFETLRFMVVNNTKLSVQALIADHYNELSGALKSAADFIVNNGFAIATRSLRSVAAESNLSPSSFSRLARAIGFEDYESLRDCARDELASQSNQLANKAQQLSNDARQPVLPRQVQACVSNIESMLSDVDEDLLESAVSSLAEADRVILIGALSSASFADYFAYLTSWFDGRWSVAGSNGVTLASSVSRLTSDDAVVVISKSPYAKRAVLATQMAAERGASVILITDSHAFPAIKYAQHVFIQKVDSPHFFVSYASTLVLIETLTAMLVARAGDSAVEQIQNTVAQNHRLDAIAQAL